MPATLIIRNLKRGLPLLAAGLLLAACGGLKAARNSYVDTTPANVRQLPPAPAPQHYDWMTGRYTLDNGEVDVNFSEAVISLDIGKPEDGDEAELSNALAGLYPDMRSAISAAGSAGGFTVLPSIDLLDVYQKYTDDRVLAALEMEVSSGDALYPGGLQAWLSDVLAALPDDGSAARRNARAFLATALSYGGGSSSLDAQTQAVAAGIRKHFEADQRHSKVTGFYTQSSALKGIFLRDRLLQTRFGGLPAGSGLIPGGLQAEREMLTEIDNALSGSITLRDAYNDFAALYASVTNPPSGATLRELATEADSGIALFPHAGSLEELLFMELPGDYPGSPMDFLREQLISGNVQLAPQPDGGWYAWQQFALETLLLPERADEYPKLAIQPAYLLRLDNAFKATITQRRETHAKDLPGELAGSEGPAPMLIQRPLLNLEPAPTVYLRTARAYGMLSRALRAQLLRRPENGSEQLGWLLAELDSAQRRYAALHCLSCNDIGQRLGLTPVELSDLPARPEGSAAPDEQLLASYGHSCSVAQDPQFDELQQALVRELCGEAELWLRGLRDTRNPAAEFTAYDPRVCVPATIVQAGPRQVIENWGVIGVRLLLLESYFQTVPQAPAGDSQSQQWLAGHYSRPSRCLIPVYEYAEFQTDAPIDREQFRSWCNQSRSKEEFMLVANAYGGSVGKGWLEQYGWWIVLLLCLGLLRDRLFPGLFGRKPAAAASAEEAGGEPPKAG